MPTGLQSLRSFPRLASRGPIEAARRSVAGCGARRFRGSRAAAPLKRRGGGKPTRAVAFPRLASRGPIEALALHTSESHGLELFPAVLAPDCADRVLGTARWNAPTPHGCHHHRRARACRGREKPAGEVTDAARGGEHCHSGPEGLAGKAAHEIGEGAPRERGTGELLELTALRLDLVVGERLPGASGGRRPRPTRRGC